MHQMFDFGLRILDFGFEESSVEENVSSSAIQNRKSKILNLDAGVAQLVERQPSKLNVASSSLVSRSNKFLVLAFLAETAQVAQG